MGVVSDWRRKSQISRESMCPGLGEVPGGIKIMFLGTLDTYKSLKAVTKIFSLLELISNKVVARQTINARWCAS
jgi:hypothetical protein